MKVKKITKVEPRPVYSIATSTKTFIADGLAHHNCYKCNLMMGGNQGEFRDRIRAELGDEKVDQLLKESKKSVKYNATEWLQKQAYYKEKLKRLKEELGIDR